MNSKKEIKIKGWCKHFQTDDETGLIVPDTFVDWHSNTLDNDLLYYLAYKIGTNTTNQALDSLFDGNGTKASVGAAQDGNDGIAHGASEVMDYILQTSLNAGGDNATAYIEFYGYVAGAATLTSTLYLGFNYQNATGEFAKICATDTINETVGAGRTYHHYWKLTLS